MAADLGGNLEGRTAFKCDNFVFGMTIGARRGVAMPGGNGFAVNAFSDVLGGLVVAGAASLG